MGTVRSKTKAQFTELLVQNALEPLRADQWIVSSSLQKAIRRGEIATAQRAALTFFGLKRSAIWRRLMIIAFEDVGAGSGDVLAMTAAAAANADFRKTCGGDVAAAMANVRILTEAPKDRSADYLICGAKDHPSLEDVRRECLHASIAQRLDAAADQCRPLEQRAVFTWYASGIEWGDEKRVGQGDLSALMDQFQSLGVPVDLVQSTRMAAIRSREPITVMVPLVWLAVNAGQPPTIAETPVPAAVTQDDVPLYALDKHTRLGRQAIARFAKENAPLRVCLETYVPERRRREAAMMAAFYADAAPVARRLMWDRSKAVEDFGTENDLLKAGVPIPGHAPLLEAVKTNLGHLNEIRSELFLRSRSEGSTPPPDDRLKRLGWTDGEVTLFNFRDRK